MLKAGATAEQAAMHAQGLLAEPRPVGVGKDGGWEPAEGAAAEQSREHVRDGDHHENVEAGSSPRAPMSGKYRTVLADPPWPMRATSRPWAGSGGRRRHATVWPYSVMSIEDICEIDVEAMIAPEAHLFLWVPASFNREGVGVSVARVWGFEPLNEIVWAKPNFGLGRFPRPQHEILLVCRRGALPFRLRDVGSVQFWALPRLKDGGRIHSAKPDGAIDLIERASPGPYLELFARRARFGWDYWGNESLGTAELQSKINAPTEAAAR